MDVCHDLEGDENTQESRAVEQSAAAQKPHLSFESFSLPSVWSPAWEGSPALRSEWRKTNDIINTLKAARAENCWAQGGFNSKSEATQKDPTQASWPAGFQLEFRFFPRILNMF